MRAFDTVPRLRQIRGRMWRSGDEGASHCVRHHLSEGGRHRLSGFARGDQCDRYVEEWLQIRAGAFGTYEMPGVDGADCGVDDVACVSAQPLKRGIQ
jgi:hypothetical protein